MVNLCDLTNHPSPNYLLVLQTARREALAADAGLLIVESDVVVKRNTLQDLFDGAVQRPDCAIAAAVTTDETVWSIILIFMHGDGKTRFIRRRNIVVFVALC